MLNFSLIYYWSEWAIRLVMLFYVPQRRTAAAARSWLLLIFLLPLPGLILYMLIGRPFLPRRRIVLQAKISQVIRDQQARLGSSATLVPAVADNFSHVVKLAQNLGDFRILAARQIELLDNYQQSIDRLIADIDSATHHVHLLYYIFAPDRTGGAVAEALLRAQQRGVTCRLLLDATGSKHALRSLARQLRAGGVEVVSLMSTGPLRRLRGQPRFDLRNHRKIAVIDGHIGYTGSQNIINADFKAPLVYEEVVVRLTGPAVAQLQAVFLADRFIETSQAIQHPQMFPLLQIEDPPAASNGAAVQLLPSGPGYPHENNQRFIVDLLHAAQKRVVITTPYFIPDDAFLQAMQTAVLRGVEVHLVVSKQIDQYLVGLGQRSYYQDLLEAGVQIHSYLQAFLHAKHVSIDDSIAIIGTSNMDIRSFLLNAEVMLVIYDPAVVAHLRQIQERYFAGSETISLEQWNKRPKRHQLMQNIARLADSLL